MTTMVILLNKLPMVDMSLLDIHNLLEVVESDVWLIKSEKVSKLTKEDGQSEKLEEKRINVKKGFKPLFSKDVNDPSEEVMTRIKEDRW